MLRLVRQAVETMTYGSGSSVASGDTMRPMAAGSSRVKTMGCSASSNTVKLPSSHITRQEPWKGKQTLPAILIKEENIVRKQRMRASRETAKPLLGILVPRGRAPFGQHQEITTSGLVQHRKSTIHGLPVTLRMLRVKSDRSDWFWFQSIVFTKPFKNRMSLDQARGRDFLVLTKRSAASGDENDCLEACSAWQHTEMPLYL